MKLKHKKALLVPVILVGIFYIGNALTGHRLAYAVHQPKFLLGSWITGIRTSPSGRYAVGIETAGLQGVTHYVKVARWYTFWPQTIMESGTEDAVMRGPEQVRLALVWSADEHAVALIHLGWFVDYYDFTTRHGESFGEGLFRQTDTNALLAYHRRIADKLGSLTTKQAFQE
jgi:hypothetical protein